MRNSTPAVSEILLSELTRLLSCCALDDRLARRKRTDLLAAAGQSQTNGTLSREPRTPAADAGSAGVGSLPLEGRPNPREVVMAAAPAAAGALTSQRALGGLQPA